MNHIIADWRGHIVLVTTLGLGLPLAQKSKLESFDRNSWKRINEKLSYYPWALLASRSRSEKKPLYFTSKVAPKSHTKFLKFPHLKLATEIERQIARYARQTRQSQKTTKQNTKTHGINEIGNNRDRARNQCSTATTATNWFELNSFGRTTRRRLSKTRRRSVTATPAQCPQIQVWLHVWMRALLL